MFTGIAEGTGEILSFVRTKDGYDAQISFTNSFNDVYRVLFRHTLKRFNVK